MLQLARRSDGALIGLPIRGYGMMVVLGIAAGVGLAAYRARRMGLEAEVIFSLALWLLELSLLLSLGPHH